MVGDRGGGGGWRRGLRMVRVIAGRPETSSSRVRCARLARGGAITSASGLSNRDSRRENLFLALGKNLRPPCWQSGLRD